MGSSLKTLQRLMMLTRAGDLPPGGAICDIGATQLFGGDLSCDGARDFLEFYASLTPSAKKPSDVAEGILARIGHGGFLGDLLSLAGFDYTALDIFHARNTILFDLNVHAPGPRLYGKFDLVMNLGTTEHVFSQLRAFQTIHELTKPGGVVYHDLPFAGYFDHALFRYDPLFFREIVKANSYEILLQEITKGAEKPVPADVRSMGYPDATVTDIGIEAILRRSSAEVFKVPMEISTSLSVDPGLSDVQADDAVMMAPGFLVAYGAGADGLPFRDLSALWLRRATAGVRRRVGL